MIIATKYYSYYCFTAAHQSGQYIIRTSNCYINAKKKFYILEEDCALFDALIAVLSACRFYMKFFRFFPWQLFCMQVKLISPLETKEQLIRFKVYGKIATSAQTNGGG